MTWEKRQVFSCWQIVDNDSADVTLAVGQQFVLDSWTDNRESPVHDNNNYNNNNNNNLV